MNIIRNNFEWFLKWVGEQSAKCDDPLFHVMHMLRKKDGKAKKDTVIRKHWFVTSAQYLVDKLPEMIRGLENEGGRIVAGVNVKSIRASNLVLAHELLNCIARGETRFPDHMYPSAVDKSAVIGRAIVVIDIDRLDGETDEQLQARTDEYAKYIDETSSSKEETVVAARVPSKTGMHLLIKACNLKPFYDKYPNVTHLGDGNTNILISD